MSAYTEDDVDRVAGLIHDARKAGIFHGNYTLARWILDRWPVEGSTPLDSPAGSVNSGLTVGPAADEPVVHYTLPGAHRTLCGEVLDQFDGDQLVTLETGKGTCAACRDAADEPVSEGAPGDVGGTITIADILADDLRNMLDVQHTVTDRIVERTEQRILELAQQQFAAGVAEERLRAAMAADDERGGRGCANGQSEAAPDVIDGEVLADPAPGEAQRDRWVQDVCTALDNGAGTIRNAEVAVRERAQVEAIAEDDARSVAEGRKLLGWDETPVERDRRMTAEFIEAMNTRRSPAAALADLRRAIHNVPDRSQRQTLRAHLDRVEAALRTEPGPQVTFVGFTDEDGNAIDIAADPLGVEIGETP